MSILTNKGALQVSVSLAVVAFAVLLVFRIQTLFHYTTDLLGIEPNVIYGIQRIMLSQALYTNPEIPPFAIIQYTPIYYYINAFTAELLQLDPTNDIHQLYVIGRCWNLFFNFGSLFLVLLILNRIFKVKVSIALFAGVLTFLLQYPLNYAVRPDSLMNLLILISVYLFVSYLSVEESGKKGSSTCVKYLVLACFFASVSVFAKQSGIVLPVLLFSYLIISKKFRLLPTAGLAITGSFGFLYLLCTYLYGNAFNQNVIDGVANGIDFLWFNKRIAEDKLFLLEVFLLFLVIWFAFRQFLQHNFPAVAGFIAYASSGLFGFALLTSLKWGSEMQYFVDFQNLGIIYIFYNLNPYLEWSLCRKLAPINATSGALVILSALFMPIFLFYQYMEVGRFAKFNAEYKSEYTNQKTVANYLTVLLKRGDFVFINHRPGNARNITGLFLPEHYIFPNSDIVVCCAYPLRVFMYDAYKKVVQQGKVKFLVTYDGVVPTEFAGVTFDQYTHLKDLAGYSVYKLRQ